MIIIIIIIIIITIIKNKRYINHEKVQERNERSTP